MLWLCTLRLAIGWLWATLNLAVGLYLLGQRPAVLAVPTGGASLCAGMVVFWVMVADPLCPRRARWLTRSLETAMAGGFAACVAWSLWLVIAE